jgi:hypothetical protein
MNNKRKRKKKEVGSLKVNIDKSLAPLTKRRKKTPN